VKAYAEEEKHASGVCRLDPTMEQRRTEDDIPWTLADSKNSLFSIIGSIASTVVKW
jgi:hypothetical protein